MVLPDIPDDLWREYDSQRFRERAQADIDHLDFLARAHTDIDAIGLQEKAANVRALQAPPAAPATPAPDFVPYDQQHPPDTWLADRQAELDQAFPSTAPAPSPPDTGAMAPSAADYEAQGMQAPDTTAQMRQTVQQFPNVTLPNEEATLRPQTAADVESGKVPSWLPQPVQSFLGGLVARNEAANTQLDVSAAAAARITPEEAARARAEANMMAIGAENAGPGVDRLTEQMAPKAVQTVGETLDRILESQAQGRHPAPPSTEIEQAVNSLGARLYRGVWDAGEPLKRAQDLVYQRLGRAPTVEEDAYLQLRLFAGRGEAAATRVREELLPAIRDVPTADQPLLNAYLAAADNADKAAAVGQRVGREATAAALQERAPAIRAATDLFKESRWAQETAGTARNQVESLAQRWDDLQQRAGQIEERLASLQEGAAQNIERPPWASNLRDADLIELARRSDINPFEPQWYERLDPATVRAYRAEVMAQGGSRLGTTRTALQQQAQALRAEQRAVQRDLGTIDPAMNRQLEMLSHADEAAERTQGAAGLLPALVRGAQMRGEATGAEAAANRLFSGGVHAQPLDQVQAAFTTRYGPQRAQRIFDAADGVWDFTSSLRARMHDAGAISDEVFQAWERDFPHYTRAEILDFLPDPNTASAGIPSGRPVLTVSDLGIKRLSEAGTVRARDLPLNSVIRQAFATETLARRNEGARAILAMREADPELRSLLKEVVGEHKLTSGEAYFSVFDQGAQKRFVGPKALVEAVTRFEPEQAGALVQTASWLLGGKLLRAGATGVNALFLPLNALRDAQLYMLRTGGYSDIRQFGRSAAALGRAYWDSFARGNSAPDLREALRAGAGQANEFYNLAPAQVLRRLTGEGFLGGRVRPVTNLQDFLGAAGDVFGAAFDPIRATGERVEQAPRLAAYRLARQAGASPEQAALRYRDVTLDFSRGGDWAKLVNRVVPFFNVGAQSPERFFRYDLASGRRLQTGLGLTVGFLAPAAAAEAWNRSQYPDDYAQVPSYLKDSGLVVMLPLDPKPEPDGTPGQRPYLWLPVPQEVAFLTTVQKQAMAAAWGDDQRKWTDVFQSIAGGFSPVGAEQGSVARFLPPAIRTGVELAANKDLFRGRQIVPDRIAGLPPSEQYTPETSAIGRAVGRAVNKPPAAVDYAVTSLAGGVGRQALAAGDLVARAFGYDAAEPRHIGVVDAPVVGGLAGTVLRNAGGQRDQYERERTKVEGGDLKAEALRELEADPDYRRSTQQERQLMRERLMARIDARLRPRRRR